MNLWAGLIDRDGDETQPRIPVPAMWEHMPPIGYLAVPIGNVDIPVARSATIAAACLWESSAGGDYLYAVNAGPLGRPVLIDDTIHATFDVSFNGHG